MTRPTSDAVYSAFEYRAGSLIWKTDRRGHVKAGQTAGKLTRKGYLTVHLGKTYTLAHHIVWFMHYGVWPLSLDHIDGDRQNNCIDNLREATVSQNNANRSRLPGKFKFKGVIKWHNRWRAMGSYLGKSVYLGLYKTEIAAAIAVNNFLVNRFGDFAVLNNIDEADCDDALRFLSKTAV